MGSIGSGASPGGTWQLADDTALTAGSPAEMQFMIDLMQEYCKHRGITLNLEKCAGMEVGRPHPPALQRNRYFMRDPKSGALVQLELVDTYKYLGIYFDSCLSMERNLQAALRSFLGSTPSGASYGLTSRGPLSIIAHSCVEGHGLTSHHLPLALHVKATGGQNANSHAPVPSHGVSLPLIPSSTPAGGGSAALGGYAGTGVGLFVWHVGDLSPTSSLLPSPQTVHVTSETGASNV